MTRCRSTCDGNRCRDLAEPEMSPAAADRAAKVKAVAEQWKAAMAGRRLDYRVHMGVRHALTLAADAGLDRDGLRELARRIAT